MPDCLEKIYLLDPDNGDIEDPIGGDLPTYQKCAERIRSHLERRVAEVVAK